MRATTTETLPTTRLPRLTLCELRDASAHGVESHSPFCLKTHRVLGALGLSYERRHFAHPGQLGALNPLGQVPVLLIGEEAVADSSRIAARLEALAGRTLDGGALDAQARAEAWLWEELADSALNGFLVAARWADDANWPAVRDAYFADMPALLRAFVPGRIRARVIGNLVARDVWRAGPDACWGRLEGLLDHLETRAPREGYWMHPRAISIADVALFGQLRSLCTPLTPRQSERVRARGALSAWIDRVDAATQPSAARMLAAA